jgi:hypothetical protein
MSRLKMLCQSIVFSFCLIVSSIIWADESFYKGTSLRVPLTVKECAGVGAKEYPVTSVVPLPYGKYYETSHFRVEDSKGRIMPAQFEALNRWWARDNSIRHIMIHFQPTVGAYGKIGKGIATYYLTDKGSGETANTPLRIDKKDDGIEVVTGPLKFTIDRRRFNILDEVWFDQNSDQIFEEQEKIIHSSHRNGGVFVGYVPDDIQLDSSREDVTIHIEESGPMRVVIRAEAVTKYFNPKNHQHGYAVRIYAYANKPFIKIDYQLQNSAKNKVFSWPLYFEEMNLDFRLDLDRNSTVRIGSGDGSVFERLRENGLFLAQEFHDKFNIYDKQTKDVLSSGKTADGFIDVSDSQKGVSAIIRYFWQTWPNGFEIDAQNTLSIQLFPSWSSQWRQRGKNRFTKNGLYWLVDMQHVYKEMILFFHKSDISDTEMIHMAKTVSHHPVVTLPTEWYRETLSTLDMAGMVPLNRKIKRKDIRTNSYKKRDFEVSRRFGWNAFFIDIHRKWGASQAGGWPYSVSAFIATERPRDYYYAEQFAIGELNVRPQWMAQYNFKRDWGLLKLTENPYAGVSWRKIKGGKYKRHFDAPFLQDSGIDVKPRDDEHAWFYHMEEAYYFTGNPWIKDWYQFVGEFRKTRLNRLDPFTNNSTRAQAHALAHALQAYRVTGDNTLIVGFRKYINKWLLEEQSPLRGTPRAKKRGGGRVKASWVGYLSRAIISFMEEVRGKDWQAYAEAFNYLSGLMEYNYNYANFGVEPKNGGIGSSNSAAQNMADPQAWYYWYTGKKKYLDHLNHYIDHGINGGQRPRRLRKKKWKGDFQGRWVQFVSENEKADFIPPKPISDLKTVVRGKEIELTWTAPQDAARYHIVWSDKPISEETTTDNNVTNWWAANAVGPDMIPMPDSRHSLTITPDSRGPFYAAIFSFDVNDNMSRMSNVAMNAATP